MGRLVNHNELDRDAECTFCGIVQPLRNMRCEQCGKRLPLPRPRFSDEMSTPHAFVRAVATTALMFGLPPLAVYFYPLSSKIHWVSLGILFGFSFLIDLVMDSTDNSHLSDALDTPDHSDAMKSFNSHASTVLSLRLISLPVRWVRRSWQQFFFALSGR